MPLLDRTETDLFVEIRLKCPAVQTLAWHEDTLVDWAGGHISIALDGTVQHRRFTPYGRHFDAAVPAPDGRHVVIYQRLGTKALLVRDGRLVRELNRSFYFADSYEYPIAFLTLPDGRTGLVHCPDEYNRLDIEDVLTGERLTTGERKPEDFFHSRLASSSTGSRFLSAGWIWHPLDWVAVFDVAAALEEPRVLDKVATFPNGAPVGIEVSAAAWLDDEHLLIAAGDDEPDSLPEGIGPAHMVPRSLGVFEVGSGRCLSAVQLSEKAGTLMPVGARHALSLYREPKLLEIATGAVAHQWAGVNSGRQASSILASDARLPPTALDAAQRRFAIANGDEITVVQFR